MSYEYHRDNNHVESMDIESTPPPPPPPPMSSSGSNINKQQPQPQQQQQQQQSYEREQLKLWVGNLPDNISEGEIREIFSKYQIDNIKLAENSNQQTCAFITFFDRDVANLAREELSNKTIHNGFRLKINWASIKPPKYTLSSSNTESTQPQPPITTTPTPTPAPLPSNIIATTSSPPQTKIIHDPYTGRQYTSYPQYHSVYYGTEPPSVNINKTTTTTTTTSSPTSTITTTSPTPLPTTTTTNVYIKITDSDPYVNKKLYIGELSSINETVEDMRRTFSKFGEVDDIMITSKGNAFIRYIKTESAILAKRELVQKYKIAYDKREPRDTYHFDPNGPFSGLAIQNNSHYDYHYKQQPPPPPPHSIISPPPQLSSSSSSSSQNSPFNEPLSNEETNQFYLLLDNLKSTNTSIRESKDWFILHLKSGRAIIELMDRYINTTVSPNKIEVIYLINDLIYFGSVRRGNSDSIDPISELFEKVLPSIISSFYKESYPIQQKLYQVLEIWESKKYYSYKTIQYFRTFINNPMK